MYLIRNIKVLLVILPVAFMILPVPSRAQITFERTYGPGAHGSSVEQTSDGGYIIAGWIGGEPGGVYLIKTDANGDTLWTRTCTYGALWSGGLSAKPTFDGGYVITGWFSPQFPGRHHVYLVKTDDNGDSLWAYIYGDDYSNGLDVEQTSDSGYIVTGWNSSGAHDFVYLIKTDVNGDTMWTRTYPGWMGFSVKQTLDGGYIIAGVSWVSSGMYDICAIKTDSNGDTLWARTYGPGFGTYVCQTFDGQYIIAGITLSGGDNICLIKVDPNGDIIWTRTYCSTCYYDYICHYNCRPSVDQTLDEGYIIVATAVSFGAGSTDFYLIKTDSEGNKTWARTYGSTCNEMSCSMQKTSDGGYIIAGTRRCLDTDSSYVYLVKTDENGWVGGEIVGMVLDSTTEIAIPYAKVHYCKDTCPISWWYWPYVTAGPEGQFIIANTTEPYPYRLATEAPGYEPAFVDAYLDSLVYIFLTPVSHTVSGTIGLVDNPTDSSGSVVYIDGAYDSTDLHGHYVISNVAVGAYNIIVSHTGYWTAVDSNVHIASDTIIDYVLYPVISDVGVDTILSPPDIIHGDSTYIPSAMVKNYGDKKETFEVICEIWLGTDMIYMDEIELTLDTEQDSVIEFKEWTVPATGDTVNYKITVYTWLPGDMDTTNNSKEKEFRCVGVKEGPVGIPLKFELFQNFPNPAISVTKITYQLTTRSQISLRIYDATGKLVRVLVDKIQDAGCKVITWDCKNNMGQEIASGIYFYKIQAGNYTETRKMILLR
jgi:hypothetical protein